MKESNLPPGVTDRMIEEQAGAFETEPGTEGRPPGALPWDMESICPTCYAAGVPCSCPWGGLGDA